MKHRAKVFRSGNIVLQAFTVDLEPYKGQIIQGLFNLYSNKEVTKFNYNRRFTTLEDAAIHLDRICVSYMEETAFSYLLLNYDSKELLGEITIASPKGVKEWYPFLYNNAFKVSTVIDLNKTWLAEFYLREEFWGNGLIPHFANRLFDELQNQNGKSIMAFCEPENGRSIKALNKLGFKDSQILKEGDYKLWVKKFNSGGIFSFFRK